MQINCVRRSSALVKSNVSQRYSAALVKSNVSQRYSAVVTINVLQLLCFKSWDSRRPKQEGLIYLGFCGLTL